MDLSGPVLEPRNATLSEGATLSINLRNSRDEGIINVKRLSGASDGVVMANLNPTAELTEEGEHLMEEGEGREGRGSEARAGADSPRPLLDSQQELF